MQQAAILLIVTSTLAGDSKQDLFNLSKWLHWAQEHTEAVVVARVEDTSLMPRGCKVTIKPLRQVWGTRQTASVEARDCGPPHPLYTVGDVDLFRRDTNGEFYGFRGAYRQFPDVTRDDRIRQMRLLLRLYDPEIEIEKRSRHLASLIAEEDPILVAAALLIGNAGIILDNRRRGLLPVGPLAAPLLKQFDNLNISQKQWAAKIFYRWLRKETTAPPKLRERVQQRLLKFNEEERPKVPPGTPAIWPPEAARHFSKKPSPSDSTERKEIDDNRGVAQRAGPHLFACSHFLSGYYCDKIRSEPDDARKSQGGINTLANIVLHEQMHLMQVERIWKVTGDYGVL